LYNYNIASDVLTGTSYLIISQANVAAGVTPNERAYELVYPNAYRFDSDGVVFVTQRTLSNPSGGPNNYYYDLKKILYASDANNQDGEVIKTIGVSAPGNYQETFADFTIVGNDVYYAYVKGPNYIMSNIMKQNLTTGETTLVYSSSNGGTVNIIRGNSVYIVWSETTSDGTKTYWITNNISDFSDAAQTTAQIVYGY